MWWEGLGKCSLAIPSEHLLSRSRESARQKGAVCAYCTAIVKNNPNSTAIVSPLERVSNVKLLGQSRAYIHGLCQNYIFFCTNTKCPPLFLLIISSGCGNGKYLHINSQVYKLGCDYCFPLVESARDEGHEVMVCHSLCLPYRSECFDAVLSIAGKFCLLPVPVGQTF